LKVESLFEIHRVGVREIPTESILYTGCNAAHDTTWNF
jgi:hypothetical protein